MIGSSHTNLVALFDDFLISLRHQGFIIGVDHYLRLQELLSRVSGQCDHAELKTLLCPIFATHRNQQEKFYKAFDTHFALFQSAPEAQPPETGEQPDTISHSKTARLKSRKKGILLLIAATLAVSILALIFLKPPLPAGDANQNENRVENRQGNDNNVNKPNDSPASGNSGKLNNNQSPPPPDLPEESPGFGPGPNKSQPPPMTALIDRELIRWSIIATPFIFFLIFEWFNHRRRKLVLQKQRGEKPPFVYTLRIEGPDSKIFNSEQLYTAARRMRRRQIDSIYSLDVAATVAATSKALGYPTFRYKSGSRIPEYLVLIDRSSFRDHQAQLFDSLVQALKKEGLYVVSYYYNGDPRICCDQNDNCVHIAQLQNKHADHHLLIFGDGDSIVDPLTGDLETWSSYFLHWQSRALLTPEAPERWGLREEALARHFSVTTADLKGLLALVDLYEKDGATGPRLLRESGNSLLPQELDKANLIQPLRNYLGEEVFQWLCACAVYPELQWGLSLFLGSLPCMESDLIKEENLLRLAKLSWFRKGIIPDETRLLLISYLDKPKEKVIRAAIIELLEQTPRTESLQNDGGNFSANTYELNLAVERWLYSKDKSHLFNLRKVIIKLPKEQVYRDYTLIRFLESPLNSRLALLLPKTLRAIFYPNAISKLNPRISLRLGLTIGLTLLVWAGLNWLMPPLSRAKILDFSASQTSVEAGSTANLYFQVSDATSLRIDPDIGDLKPTDKDVVPVTLDQTTTYKLTASDSAGRIVSRELTIEVTGKERARIVSFYAERSTIIPGEVNRLCYELRYTGGYKIYGDSGELLADTYSNGASAVLPMRKDCIPEAPIKTTKYTLEATGEDGFTISQTLTVEVVSKDAVRIDSFKADSSAISQNESTRLCFQVSNASKTEIVSNTGEVVKITGDCATIKPAATTVYTLIATGQNGQQQQSLTVSVITTQPFIKEFSANPPVITAEATTQLCLQLINASHVRLESDGLMILNSSADSVERVCTTVAPKKTTIYTLTATSSSGVNTQKQITVEVNFGVQITDITIDPDPVIPNQAAVMCIKFDNPQNVESVGFDPFLDTTRIRGNLSRDDNCYTFTAQETKNYSAIVRSKGGQFTTKQFTINVQPVSKVPVITSLTANPPAIAKGERVDVCYRVENANGVTYSEQGKAARLPEPLNVNRGYEVIPVIARQIVSGAISGTVVDSTQKPVEGARITAVDELKGSKYSAVTDRVGTFYVLYLPPGMYRIVVSKEGYQDETVRVMVQIKKVNEIADPIVLRPEAASSNRGSSPVASQSDPGPKLPIFVEGNQSCLSFQPKRTTTYTVTAKNSAGTDTKSVTVTVK
jgi:hypothetical protein